MQNQTTKASTPSTTITKKIGHSIYKIQIHFSKPSKETINDKLIRIIKNDIAENAERLTMKMQSRTSKNFCKS